MELFGTLAHPFPTLGDPLGTTWVRSLQNIKKTMFWDLILETFVDPRNHMFLLSFFSVVAIRLPLAFANELLRMNCCGNIMYIPNAQSRAMQCNANLCECKLILCYSIHKKMMHTKKLSPNALPIVCPYITHAINNNEIDNKQ